MNRGYSTENIQILCMNSVYAQNLIVHDSTNIPLFINMPPQDSKPSRFILNKSKFTCIIWCIILCFVTYNLRMVDRKNAYNFKSFTCNWIINRQNCCRHKFVCLFVVYFSIHWIKFVIFQTIEWDTMDLVSGRAPMSAIG